MAQMRTVNRAIRREFPHLDIEMVNGGSYFYFAGVDGMDKVESIYWYPRATTNAEAIAAALENIDDALECGVFYSDVPA